jgi:hypothetical protein
MFTAIRLFVTYIKKHPFTKEKYAGMASGEVEEVDEDSAREVLKRREAAPHHKNKDGFLEAELDIFTTDYDAARGREQMLKEAFEQKGTGTKQNNPVGPRNKKKPLYMNKAFTTFGDILISILILFYYFNV